MQAMTNKNAKTFFFASLIAAMVLPFAMMDYADAACSECGDPNSLRVKADYETVGWWSTNHHLADDWTYVKAGQTKSSTTTATQSESGYVYPSFLIKSNSLDSKTASYEVTYEFYDATQGLKGTDTRIYNNMEFSSYLDGETDRFTAHSGGIDEDDYVVITLKVNSLS